LFIVQAAGYGKVVSHVIIGLKTVKGTKQLKLDPTIYDSLQKERVQVRETSGWPFSAVYIDGWVGEVGVVGRRGT
jgi:RuvB-like protein 1 (pontin 52)